MRMPTCADPKKTLVPMSVDLEKALIRSDPNLFVDHSCMGAGCLSGPISRSTTEPENIHPPVYQVCVVTRRGAVVGRGAVACEPDVRLCVVGPRVNLAAHPAPSAQIEPL